MPFEKSQPLIPPQRDSQGEEKMPDPDLNPLTNPTLARNLGKWAQVYFTTPREQRDHAVAELLRELEASGSADFSRARTLENLPAKTPEAHAQLARAGPVSRMRGVTSEFVCPRCRQHNAPQQTFCGHCGSALPGTNPVGYQKMAAPALEGNDRTTLPRASSASSRMSEAQQTDLEWLREKSLGGFRPRDRTSHPFRKLFVLVLLIAGVFFYFQWRNGAGVLSTWKPELNVSSPAAAQPKAAIAEVSPPGVKSSTDVRRHAFSAADQPQKKGARKPVAPDESEASAVATTANDSREPASEVLLADNGERELAIAEDFLKGGAKARDASEAAKWLWKSISKHNTSALVLLADLYQRGDGVGKSCEQAQVLLTAGAKRGSADAAQKLRNLQSSGCK